MVDLLNQHECTLRQVYFEHIGMFDADDTSIEWPWERILFRVRSMRELQQAKLKDLCTVDESFAVLRLRELSATVVECFNTKGVLMALRAVSPESLTIRTLTLSLSTETSV